MGIKYHKTIHFLRLTVFIAIMYGLVAQPTFQSFSFFGQADRELAVLDIEVESDEKNKKQEDVEDEKSEFQIVYIYDHQLVYNNKEPNFNEHEFQWDFRPEIPIPPPEGA